MRDKDEETRGKERERKTKPHEPKSKWMTTNNQTKTHSGVLIEKEWGRKATAPNEHFLCSPLFIFQGSLKMHGIMSNELQWKLALRCLSIFVCVSVCGARVWVLKRARFSKTFRRKCADNECGFSDGCVALSYICKSCQQSTNDEFVLVIIALTMMMTTTTTTTKRMSSMAMMPNYNQHIIIRSKMPNDKDKVTWKDTGLMTNYFRFIDGRAFESIREMK